MQSLTNAKLPHECKWKNNVLTPIPKIMEGEKDNEGWIDPDFPHDESSLGTELRKEFPDADWVRSVDFVPSNEEKLFNLI